MLNVLRLLRGSGKLDLSSGLKKEVQKSQRYSGIVSVNGDLVGPPDPVSNLRPVVFHIPENETETQRRFRLKREQVQNWNKEFWSRHNALFNTEKQEFIKLVRESKLSPGEREAVPDTALISPDEMSIFYKSFLDKYWRSHALYLFQWYRFNSQLLLYSLSVQIDNFKRKFKT